MKEKIILCLLFLTLLFNGAGLWSTKQTRQPVFNNQSLGGSTNVFSNWIDVRDYKKFSLFHKLSTDSSSFDAVDSLTIADSVKYEIRVIFHQTHASPSDSGYVQKGDSDFLRLHTSAITDTLFAWYMALEDSLSNNIQPPTNLMRFMIKKLSDNFTGNKNLDLDLDLVMQP